MRVLLLLSLGLCACTPVRAVWLRTDWSTVQADRIKRIQVLVAPLPADRDDLGALWGTLTREYINEHLDFLVYSARWSPEISEREACAAPLDGLLRLRPQVSDRGTKVRVGLHASLYSCHEHKEVWRATGRLTARKKDPLFEATAEAYAERLGPPVRDYVAASFRLLQQVADRLPKPRLTEADIDEKIDLD